MFAPVAHDDPIEGLVESWEREIPELEFSSMASVARLNRMSLLIARRIEATLNANGSSVAEFDVLSALRRGGAPYRLKPSELSREVMLSPSGMTHRVDLLERAGLVQRHLDPANRRTMPVSLTDDGIHVADHLVRLVLEAESAVLEPLSPAQRTSLDKLANSVIAGLVERTP